MDKTQIVTQLVAALFTNDDRHISKIFYEDQSKAIMHGKVIIDYACMVADEIIDKTTEPIEFPQ